MLEDEKDVLGGDQKKGDEKKIEPKELTLFVAIFSEDVHQRREIRNTMLQAPRRST